MNTPNPIPIPYDKKEILVRYGEYAILFAHLENNMREFICRLINDKDMSSGEIVVNHFTFRTTWSKLLPLYMRKVKEANKIKLFEKLIDDLQIINGERNDIIHGQWLFGISVTLLNRVVSPKKELTYSDPEITPEYFDEKIKTLSELNSRLLKIVDDYKNMVKNQADGK